MKAIIEFDLDNPDDIEKYERINKADQMAGLLWEIALNKRQSLYEITDPEKVVDTFYDWFNDEMSSRGINIEQLFK